MNSQLKFCYSKEKKKQKIVAYYNIISKRMLEVFLN